MEIPKSCAECPNLKTSLLQNVFYCDWVSHSVSDPINGRPDFCPYGYSYKVGGSIKVDGQVEPVSATEVKAFYDNFYGVLKGEKFIPSRPTPISQTSYKMGRGSVMNSIKPKRIIRQGQATIIFWDNPRYETPEKTVVKCMEDDHYDLYAAFCIAVCKKLFGSNSRIKSMIKKAVKAQEEIEAKKAKKAKKK